MDNNFPFLILGRWLGISLISCLVLTLIFGENGPYSKGILAFSIVLGVLGTFFLTKKDQATLQSHENVVE